MVKVAVLGCGILGTKIAGELAYHGHRVTLYDANVNTLNGVYYKINEDKQSLREEGLLATNTYVGQILCFSRLEDTVRDVEFVFEAIVDDLQIKQQLFEKVAALCNADTVISTNTLNLDINEVFATVPNKQRTVGLRFLFPVHYIPEVEITPTASTGQETIEKTRKFMERMGKTLFFRSGHEPLILTEEQREMRKQARLEEIKNSSGVGYTLQSAMPALSHRNSIGRGNRIYPIEASADDTNSNTEQECAICLDRPRNCLLCPCHHMVTCSQCAKQLENRSDHCPVCRNEITEIIRVYQA